MQVFFGYAIVTPEDCTLFVQPTALDEAVREYLHANGVAVLDYESVWNQLQTWGERLKVERKGGSNTPAKRDAEGNVVKKEEEKATAPEEKVVKTDKVLIGHKTSWAVVKAVGEENIELRKSPVEEAKAKKNAVSSEILCLPLLTLCRPKSKVSVNVTSETGWRWCDTSPGWKRFFYEARHGRNTMRLRNWRHIEGEFVIKSLVSRLMDRENKLFMGLSFETISSTGPNAGELSRMIHAPLSADIPAVIHYSPPREGSSVIDVNEIYLCDSGGESRFTRFGESHR